MPGMDGMELQKHIKKIDNTIIVIIITAYATVDTAVDAMKEGAFDYLSKPIDPDKLSILIRNAVNQRRLIAENIQLRQKVEELTLQDEIVGESPQIKKILEMIDTVAKTDATGPDPGRKRNRKGVRRTGHPREEQPTVFSYYLHQLWSLSRRPLGKRTLRP